jgi:hypothetical protein
MQQLKELEQFNQIYKKTQKKTEGDTRQNENR